MEVESKRSKRREDAISALNAAIEAANLAEKISCIAPAKTLFSSVSILLKQIRACFLLSCNGLLRVHIQPGLNGQRLGSRRTRAALCRYLQSA